MGRVITQEDRLAGNTIQQSHDVDIVTLPNESSANEPSTNQTRIGASVPEHVGPATSAPPSLLRQTCTVINLCGINFMFSAATGLITVGLPVISEDLKLTPVLLFWPISVANLATASSLLVSGSIADVIGPTIVDLSGTMLVGVFTLAVGGARTGVQLVVLRALQGVGIAMHSAASVAIISLVLPRGRGRNFAFSCLGLSQPLGFSFGLVVGGVLIETAGWRSGWYAYGSSLVALTIFGVWILPHHRAGAGTFSEVRRRMRHQVDWIGAVLATTFMTLLSYLLANLSTDIAKIRQRGNIVLVCLVVISLCAFPAWIHWQVQRGRPALIPNSFWRISAFSTICGTLILSFAVLNSLELFASLFFQEIQHLSPLQASIRILPSLVIGAILNITIGIVIHRVQPFWIITISSLLCAGSPLLMAVTQPHWPYWSNPFIAQLLQPVSGDVLFTIGLIVISEIFPPDKQALAGAVFSTSAQFGNALGLATMQIVSNLVKTESERSDKPDALLKGYRAGFWTMFSMMLTCAVWGGFGFWRSDKIGRQQDGVMEESDDVNLAVLSGT